MKSLTLIGVVLVVLGIGGLVYQRVSYTTQETVLDIGPLKATAETQKTVAIPQIASVAAIVAGLALAIGGQMKKP